MALTINNKTLVADYTWVWDGDPCWKKKPAAAWSKAWADYERTGDWSKLPREGEPTVFTLAHIESASAKARLKDTYQGGEIHQSLVLAARLALREIRNPDVDLELEFDPKLKCMAVSEKDISKLYTGAWQGAIESLGLYAVKRMAVDPLSSTGSG